jgi:hypothetical protein
MGVFGTAPSKEPELFFLRNYNLWLLQNSSDFVFFTEKQLLQKNVWQGSSGGARAGAREKPYQTGSK